MQWGNNRRELYKGLGQLAIGNWLLAMGERRWDKNKDGGISLGEPRRLRKQILLRAHDILGHTVSMNPADHALIDHLLQAVNHGVFFPFEGIQQFL
jgi:hypothetical protein